MPASSRQTSDPEPPRGAILRILNAHFKRGMLTHNATRLIQHAVDDLGHPSWNAEQVKRWVEGEKGNISARNQLEEVSALAHALNWAVRNPNPDPTRPEDAFSWPQTGSYDESPENGNGRHPLLRGDDEGNPLNGLYSGASQDRKGSGEVPLEAGAAADGGVHTDPDHFAGLLRAVTTAAGQEAAQHDAQNQPAPSRALSRSRRSTRRSQTAQQRDGVSSPRKPRRAAGRPALSHPDTHIDTAQSALAAQERYEHVLSPINDDPVHASPHPDHPPPSADGTSLEIRAYPPQLSTDIRAAGVHSAAALFRQPSTNSKKYTRPPMSRLFVSLGISPEAFIHLQSAAKAYMLSPHHAERQNCVGNRGKGDTDMVKLRLYHCVKEFLEREGHGERFFGRDVVYDDMPAPRQLVWPDAKHAVIAAVTPLLRRMVTNERQRQYAVETRRGGGGGGGGSGGTGDGGGTTRKRKLDEVDVDADSTYLTTTPDAHHLEPPPQQPNPRQEHNPLHDPRLVSADHDHSSAGVASSSSIAPPPSKRQKTTRSTFSTIPSQPPPRPPTEQDGEREQDLTLHITLLAPHSRTRRAAPRIDIPPSSLSDLLAAVSERVPPAVLESLRGENAGGGGGGGAEMAKGGEGQGWIIEGLTPRGLTRVRNEDEWRGFVEEVKGVEWFDRGVVVLVGVDGDGDGVGVSVL